MPDSSPNPRQFSLRAMLFAMAGIAVLLGLFGSFAERHFVPEMVGVCAIALLCIGCLLFFVDRRDRTREVIVAGVAMVMLGVAGLTWTWMQLVAEATRCIVEGQHIATPDGDLKVEHVQIGQRVFSQTADGTLSVATVTARQSHIAASHLTILLADGTELSVTAEHPIATADGWRPAGQLHPGDYVATLRGYTPVRNVECHHSSARVFDLTVAPHHTYHVEGVLVHNKTFSGNR